MILDTDKLLKAIGIAVLAWISGSLLMAARADTRVATYQINGKATDFLDLEDKRLLISKSCQKPGGKEDELKCDAFEATQGKEQPEIKMHGGENPGALICKELKAEVVWGVDERRNQVTFCRFKDGSLVSNGSLTYWLMVRKK